VRVLITGGAGYVGCLVTRKLLDAGHHPVVLDTFNWGADPLADVRERITVVEGDCRSSKDLIYALEGVDSVVHLAGIVGEAACKLNYRAHHTINVESTRTLVNCCTDPNLDLVRDFVFLSSCSVYGNVKGLHDEVTESTPPRPLSLYADAKLQSERIIRAAAREQPAFAPTVLRATTVFGWSPRPRLDLLTNLFVHQALTAGKLSVFGDGMQYRSLIHVDDIADAIVSVLLAPRFLRANGVFHVGEESNNKTVREVAEIVKGVIPGTTIEVKDDAPTDRRDYRISCQTIKNTFGWQARHTVEQGVSELAEKLRASNEDWSAARFRNDRFDYR